MGLDQEILRGNHNIQPQINQNTGEWINAKTLMYLRKSYWLHNSMMEIGTVKLKKSLPKLNAVCIPLTREELLNILEKSKECVKIKSSYVIDDYFNYDPDLYYSGCLDYVIADMKEFNKTMSKFLKNKKENDYYYWSWW